MGKSNKGVGMSLSEELREVIKRLKDKTPELIEVMKRDKTKGTDTRKTPSRLLGTSTRFLKKM